MRGVQLVMPTDQPCQSATYQVINFTLLGTQNDVFLTLNSLRIGCLHLLYVVAT